MLTSVRQLVRHGVVIVLILAGLADILSGDPLMHGLALVTVAIALVAEEVRRRRPGMGGDRPRRVFRVGPAMGVAGLAFAVFVGSFDRFSWPLTIAVAIPGAAAVAFAWRGTPVAVPPAAIANRAGTLVWAGVFIALGLWELEALLLQPSWTTSSWAHPTLSTLMDPVLASHAGRSISLVVWLVIGGWLLER